MILRRRRLRRRMGCFVAIVLLVIIVAVGAARRAGAQDAGMVVARDVPYATHESHDPQSTSLDIYAPNNALNAPVLIYIHGGAWAIGDKRYVHEKPAFFTENGFVFVSINYRLVPDVAFPENAQDVADALAWVHRNIATYGGDPARMYVIGHSAGAHLAALVSMDARYLQNAGADLNILDGTILLDGAGYDIPLNIETTSRRGVEAYTKAFGSDPTVWEEASPVNYAEAGIGIPPFLVIHVARREVSRVQAEGLARVLQEASVETTVLAAPTKTHMTLNRELGLPGDEPSAWVLSFLQGQ